MTQGAAMPSPPPLAPDPSADALREAQRRAARGGMKRTVLLLHLSGLSGTEVYHARVARAVMADAARLLEGEVLRLSDGDLALVCAFVPGFTRGPDDDGPDGLPSVLRRLFARVTPPDGDLFRCWHLPAEGASLLAFLDARPAAPARPDAAPAGRDPLVVFGLEGLQPDGAVSEAAVDAALGYVRAFATCEPGLLAGVSVDASRDPQ